MIKKLVFLAILVMLSLVSIPKASSFCSIAPIEDATVCHQDEDIVCCNTNGAEGPAIWCYERNECVWYLFLK